MTTVAEIPQLLRTDMETADLTRGPSFAPAPGLVGRAQFGEAAMVVRVEFEPNAEAPAHSHPQEQFGYLLEGSMVVRTATSERELTPGSVYYMPSGVEHAACAGADGAVTLEVFHPLRQDYLNAARGLPVEPFS